MKKAIAAVALFHGLCFISAIAAELMRSSGIMATAFLLDMIGAVICPIALAVVAGVTSIRAESPVLRLYPGAAAVTGGIGLARGILFFSVSSLAGFGGAMRYLLISFLLLTVWFIIFELTRFMMTRETKYNRQNKKSRK